jgi:hypothetical protein
MSSGDKVSHLTYQETKDRNDSAFSHSQQRVRVTILSKSPRLARVAEGFAQMSHGVE